MSGRVGSITTDIIADGLVFNMDAANRASTIPNTNTTQSFNTLNPTVNSGSFYNDVSLISPPTSASSWSFDGVDGYIEIDAPLPASTLEYTKGATACVWFKQVENGTLVNIISRSGRGSDNGFWYAGAQSNKLKWNVGSWLTGATTYSDGVWNYVCYVLDPINSIAQIYLNGKLDATETSVATVFSLQADLGTIGGLGPGGTSRNFYGWIANVTMYDRTLSANEVLHNYNALKGRFS